MIKFVVRSILLSLLSLHVQAQEISYVDYVNPLVGTLSDFELSSGNTYPVISRPWGMNSWTPQTGKMGDGWQYTYSAKKIRGFKQTHQPSPWINDYGQFSVMPMVGDSAIFDEDKRASWFSHKAEQAKPYSYSVYLADYDTEVEFAPSERAAAFSVKYGEQSTMQTRWLLVDAFDGGSSLRQLDAYTLVGISRKNSGGVPSNFANYFVVRFTQPIAELKTQTTQDKQGLNHSMVAVRLNTEERAQTFYVASSFVSEEHALINLKEVQGQSVKAVAEIGRAEWNKLLGRIAVKGEEQKSRTFYSNLYRCLLFPRRFYELNQSGDTIHYSPYNGKVERGYMYTDTGVWDTFRALFPLIN